MRYLKKLVYQILTLSLVLANRQSGRKKFNKKLEKIVPDLSDQYTMFKIDMDNKFIVQKIRNQHAFQISLALKSIELLNNKSNIVNVVDIGDSSGTHLIYLNELMQESTTRVNAISVNLDSVAVDKINSKGLKAILCKAEELHLHGDKIVADIFLSYEMLEHLFDPISFLHNMAEKSQCEFFVLTIPYLTKSRVALQFVKYNKEGIYEAENTHIFELSPKDWDIVFKFSGWEIVYKELYTQYPRWSIFNLTKYIWRRFDFDGFYGVILRKNDKFSKRYLHW